MLLSHAMKGATENLSTLSQYNALKKQAQADRELYNSLYAKVKEAAISAASKSTNIHVVNQARILDYPTRPHRLLNFRAGLRVGLIGAVSLPFLREGIEDRIHTADDIRSWTGLSSISVVPAMRDGYEQRRIGRTGPKLLLAAGQQLPQNSDLF